MLIRKATINDLKEIAEVEATCFPPAEAATEKAIRERLEVYADHFWTLFEEDKLISFVNGMVTDEPDLRDEMYENAKLHNPEGKWQMIFGVTTLPEYQGNGYAALVMERVISDCKAQGRKGIVLTCKDRLIKFYEQFGFVNEGESQSEHGGATWYEMRLLL